MERCLSGRWCNIGNVVYGNVPQVRILSSPPKPKNPAFYAGFFVFWRRGQRGRGSLRFACRLCRHTPRGSRLRETALSCPMVTKKLCYISLRPRILCGIFCVLAERTERKRFLAVRVPEGCLQPEETRRGAPACGKRRYPVRYYRNTLTRILCGIFYVLAERTEMKRFLAVRVSAVSRHTPRLTRLRGKRRYPVR